MLVTLTRFFVRQMSREFKSVPYFAVKSADDGRTRKGICAVFGNVDSAGDRIMAGAFQKTISEGSKRVKHLWNHDFSTPPIASIKELKEVGRDELPAEVLAFAPEATGGLMVAREYYDTELSNWVLAAIDAGDVSEMSFGYDVLGYAESAEDGKSVRNLTELKLYDSSDVLWGCNAATVASGAKNNMPLGVLLANINSYAEDVKAGRRNASADMDLIKGIHGAITALGYADCAPVEAEKSEPEPLQPSTSLDLLKLKNRAFALRTLTTNGV